MFRTEIRNRAGDRLFEHGLAHVEKILVTLDQLTMRGVAQPEREMSTCNSNQAGSHAAVSTHSLINCIRSSYFQASHTPSLATKIVYACSCVA